MLKKRISIAALIIAIVMTLYYCLIFFGATVTSGTGSGGDVITTPGSDTAYGGIFSSLQVNDSLPYSRYKQKEDSFKTVQQRREMINNSNFFSGQSIGSIGIAKFRPEDDLPDDLEFQIHMDSLNAASEKLPAGKDPGSLLRKQLEKNQAVPARYITLH